MWLPLFSPFVVKEIPMHFTDLNSLVVFFGSLAGVGSFIAVLINIGKTVGLVKEGQAQAYSLGMNLAGLMILFVVGIVKPDVNIQGMDAQMGAVGSVLMIIFSFAWQLYSSKFAHDNILKGTPIIGASFTLLDEQAKAKAFEDEIARRTTA